MGVLLTLISLTDANIERVMACPALVDQIEENRVAPFERAFWNAARGLHGSLEFRAGEAIEVCCLDKQWHTIHYLLTGTADDGAPPRNMLVAGGRPFPDAGPNDWRFASAEEVGAFAAALRGIPDGELLSRFDPEQMEADGVYRVPTHEGLPYLLHTISEMRAAVDGVVRDGFGLIIEIE